MNDLNSNLTNKRVYDLEERTAVFAEKIIDIMKTIRSSPMNSRIIEQLIGCSGSIGANYCEANEAESKKDFIHKMGIAKKEIKETEHWLRLLARVEDNKKVELRECWSEAQELLLIFSKIISSSRKIR